MNKDLKLGLIGFPLGHSLSPILHQAALAEAGLPGSYSLFQIPPLPEGQAELEACLQRLRDGELHGLNVTIPHKQSVLPLVDELTPAASVMGACNTLFMKDKHLIGDNTDAPGFWGDVSKLPLTGQTTALVLGAGGAARAVVYALLRQGWQVIITDLRRAQALDLQAHFQRHSPAHAAIEVIELLPAAIAQAAAACGLLVNATPVGMHPHIEECPWPENLPFPQGICIYDVVYNPLQTRLLQLAAQAGLPCSNGLGMLVEQAALAFERWTGFSPSRSKMLEEVSQYARSRL